MPLPLLIFDLDGTLVDSEMLSAKAVLEVMPVAMTLDEFCVRYRGAKLSDTIADMSARFGVPVPDDYQGKFAARADVIYRSELKSFAGVNEALGALPHRKCVASNAKRSKVEMSLEITGLTDHFAPHLFSAYDLESWKPDPGIFLRVAEHMGHDVADCIVIEDSEVGIAAAQGAGMRVVQHVHANGIAPVPGLPVFDDYSNLPKLIASL